MSTQREAFDRWWARRGLGVGTGKRLAWHAFLKGVEQRWRPIATLSAPNMEDDVELRWAASDDVLFCDSRTGLVAQGYLEVRQAYDEGAPVDRVYLIKGGWEVIQPTHWMPLPLPPGAAT